VNQVGADGKGEFVIVNLERVATAGASKRGKGKPRRRKRVNIINDLRC
jgi:hypothetical protein